MKETSVNLKRLRNSDQGVGINVRSTTFYITLEYFTLNTNENFVAYIL